MSNCTPASETVCRCVSFAYALANLPLTSRSVRRPQSAVSGPTRSPGRSARSSEVTVERDTSSTSRSSSETRLRLLPLTSCASSQPPRTPLPCCPPLRRTTHHSTRNTLTLSGRMPMPFFTSSLVPHPERSPLSPSRKQSVAHEHRAAKEGERVVSEWCSPGRAPSRD